MAGQNVQYAVTASSNLKATFNSDEAAALRLEASIAGVNDTLREMAMAAGVGLGLHAIFDFGKDIVETATKLESYRNLIKFASDTTYDAAENQRNLTAAVHDFKLPIMETYTEYAQLMAMVKGTPVEGERTRKMFHDLAETLTILHLPAERVQAAIGGIGKLLEEGNLQPRYLRPLIATLPGFGMNLAKEMGVSMEQLNVMIAKGQMTHTSSYGFIPKVLEDMKNMYAAHLPEALQSYIAQTNELNNAWIEFKDSLAMKLKPEIIGLFKDLETTIDWLKKNEDALIHWGAVVGDLVKIWVEYKLVMGGINLIQAASGIIFGTQAKAMLTQTAAAADLNAELVLMNINLETMIALQAEAMGVSGGIGMAGGILSQRAANGAFNLPINTAGATSGVNAAGIGATIVNGAMMVGLSFIGLEAMEAINNAFSGKHGDEGYKFSWKDMFTDPYYSKAGRAGESEANHNFLQDQINKKYINQKVLLPAGGENLFNIIKLQDEILKREGGKFDVIKSLIGYDKFGALLPHTNADLYDKMSGLGYNLGNLRQDASKGKGGKGVNDSMHIAPPNDKITGQHVITYNILQGGKVIGQTITNQNVNGTKADTEIKADDLARILLAIINDSEIH